MKKCLYSILIVVLCLSFPVSKVFADEQTETLEPDSEKVYRSATEYNYPPFSVTEDGKADGFSVELLKAVAQEAGLSIKFKIDEWSVLKEELKRGELDVLPLVSYSEERDQYYDFTVPYIVMHGNIFVRKDNDTINSEGDLFDKKIVVMEGDTAHEYAERMSLTEELILTDTFEEAFRLLAEGSYDAVLAQSLVGTNIINDLELRNIEPVYQLTNDGVSRTKTKLSGFEQKFCFAVREGDKELLTKLNEGLAVVSANGTYNQLYQKWFPFLLENQPSLQDILKHLAYIMIPVLLLIMIIFNIVVKQEVKRKTRELQAANEAKSRFLANMSHELRTPLNVILGYSALMQQDADLSEKGIQSLKIINTSGKHLLALINDILDITKIESQKVALKIEPFDFHQLIKDIEAMFSMEVSSKKLKMHIQGLAAVPRNVSGDVLKLRMVFINLVGNAIKFTEKGGIFLRFSIESEWQDHFRLKIAVQDTGIGIPENERKKLFQLFSQTESGQKAAKGSGLGLAISQEYVRMMGGEIKVDSMPGAGSTFYFTIDLQLSMETGFASGEEGKDGGRFRISPDSKQPVVMVAEDVQESRTLLVRMLTDAGCRVLEAENGKQAIELTRQYRPDFIWMDIRMPVLDGLTATRTIKEMEPEYQTVIAALSAHVFEDEREAILAAGCDDFLGKPFKEQDVFHLMAKHLDISFDLQPVTEDLLKAALETLTQEERKALKEALLLLDQEKMLAIAAKIRLASPKAAEVLEAEINAMNYTMILKQVGNY